MYKVFVPTCSAAPARSFTSIRLNEQQNTGKTSLKPGKVILLTSCHYSREIIANSKLIYRLFTDFIVRNVSLLYIHIFKCDNDGNLTKTEIESSAGGTKRQQ